MNEKNQKYDMTESYHEISNFLTTPTNSSGIQRENHDDSENDVQNQCKIENNDNFDDHDNNDVDDDDDTPDEKDPSLYFHKRPKSLICDKSFPYNLEGTVSRDGDMTHFVADNLEYKIKLSSPITKIDINQPGSSKNSTPSAPSSLLPHNFLNTQLSQIDSNVLNDIEIEAQYLAASIDSLTENLCNLLHSISSITADNIEIHKSAVIKLTDGMDANIKCMYTIMAKAEEISKSMKPTEQLAVRIREIKKLVDMLENNL